MLLEEFRSSLPLSAPPEAFSLHGKALWFAEKGDWKKAHDIVQEIDDQFSSRIHAFLHRQEGDIPNASYWYSKAGVTPPDFSLSKEREELVRKCL